MESHAEGHKGQVAGNTGEAVWLPNPQSWPTHGTATVPSRPCQASEIKDQNNPVHDQVSAE